MKIKKPWVSWEEFEKIQTGDWTPHPHTHVMSDVVDIPWAWADVNKTDSNLTDLATRQHAGLTNITANQHHAQSHTLVSHTARDHHHLTGLGDDDHSQYLLASGARALTANWDAGAFQIRALKFYSDQATGTPPLTVLSTTMVTNLNADRLHNVVISGLTVGHVLKATAAAALAFQPNNLGGLSDITLGTPEEASLLAYNLGGGFWYAGKPEYDIRYRSYLVEWEFWDAIPPSPWASGPISGGSASSVASTASHPGQIKSRSGGAANSGYYWIAANNNLKLKGQEQIDFVFKTASAWASRMNRFGFQDSLTIALPTDGAYIDLNGRFLTGKTRKAGVGSTTGTGYNTSASTWYRVRIIVNSSASLITFLLYSAAGAQLWTNTLATNIPTASTGFGIVSYYTAVAAGTTTITMDLAYLVCARGLVR